MPTARKSSRSDAAGKSKTPHLGRDSWLDAAFDAVVEGGFDKVRVLVLADTLGVTRGSCYWHFSDPADLLAALFYLTVTGSFQALARPASPAATARAADFIRGVIADYLITRQAAGPSADPPAS